MRNSFIIALTIFVLSRKSLSETVLLDNEDDAPSAEGFHGYSNNLDLAEFNTSNIESLPETTTTPKPSTTQTPAPIRQTQETPAQRTERAMSIGNIASLLMEMKNAILPVAGPYILNQSPETASGLDLLIEKYSPKMTKAQIRAIYLGTQWCGDGNISPDGNHVGYFFLTDSCCKQHDMCPDSIGANESKHGLSNSGKFTRSHCECDSKFFECLKAADTAVSKQIGFIYFNVLGPECYREEFLIDKCRHRHHNRCLTYILHKNSTSKSFQWFDNKFF